MTDIQNPELLLRQTNDCLGSNGCAEFMPGSGFGAALGLLFGVSGILLNHRTMLKIPAAKMEQSQIELALPAPLPADAKTVTWTSQSFQQPGQWRVDFHSPQQSVNAEYWVLDVQVFKFFAA
ncbi:hypothetical protein [Methylobacter svalbardensis]|uniref:hypothetical protein n=1 Tax=Methylobacter svalbardensis TaxID=3080016 RepID=UPI0030EF0707